MMKKYILLLFTLIFSLPLLAQLEVKEGSFKEVPGFVNINSDQNYQSDDNDLPFAVIKVRTENINDKQRRELQFSGNAGTFIMLEYKDGEVWVYLTAQYAEYLKISHPDLSSTEFTLPFDLNPKHGYELTLINKMINNVILSGSLSIITKPENGATITLNGKVISSKTPYINDIIPAGKYEITVSKERYKTVTQNIEIKGGEDKKLEIEMPIDVATITLKADIETEIYVDGKNMKKGTWIGELNSGHHEIIYKKQYHKDASQTIFVEGGKSQTYELLPIPIVGCLDLTSTPSDATVLIDGKDYGLTPLSLTDLLIGNHKLRLLKNGFNTLSVDITIKENDTLTINKTLVETPATIIYGITITTTSNYDQIYVDGKYEGHSPITVNLSEGSHIVKAYRGYTKNEEVEKEIVVKQYSTREFKILFKSDIQGQLTNKQETHYTSNSYNDRDDRKINFDIGCFIGIGFSSIKCTNNQEHLLNTFSEYFAKGLYSAIKINKIGLKIEITNYTAKGDYKFSENSHTYPYLEDYYLYRYSFSMINIPILIGYELDKTNWFLFSAYIGPQINICNRATRDILDYYSETAIYSNQSIIDYEKKSLNLIGEINLGMCYKKVSISFLSLKFDITKPTMIKNHGTETFLGNLKASSFIWGMQIDYNF